MPQSTYNTVLVHSMDTSSDLPEPPSPKRDPFWLMMAFVPVLGVATWVACMFLARDILVSERITHSGEAEGVWKSMQRCICFANISCYGHTVTVGSAPTVESPRSPVKTVDGDLISENGIDDCGHYCEKDDFVLFPNFYFVVGTTAISLAILVSAFARYHLLASLEGGPAPFWNVYMFVVCAVGCASCVVMSLLPSNHKNPKVAAAHVYFAYGGFGLAFVYEIMHLIFSWNVIESSMLRIFLTVLLVIPPVSVMLWSSGGEEDHCASVGEWICAASNYSYLMVYSFWFWKMYTGGFDHMMKSPTSVL